MSAEQRCINWTETARIQLVEAVIKVEREMMSNASQNMKIDKWNAIRRLLPAELQAKTWSSKRQSYNIPKCYSMFHNLVKAYRDKVAGKVERRGNLFNLTEPVCKILKRREDLLKGKGSVTGERRLRPGSSKRVNASTLLSSSRIVQQLSTKVANSSEAQSLSSKQGAACDIELESIVEEAPNFDSNAEKEQETKWPATKGRSKGNGKIQWTETGCLLVIEAVRQVEEETMNEPKIPIQSSTGRPLRKWARIEILLPPALRGRTWNSQRQRHNKYKCERLFDTVLKAYRDSLRRSRRSTHGLLTKPVCDHLRRLLRVRSSLQAENSRKSGSSHSVSRSTCSASDQENLSETGYNCLKDQACSRKLCSTGTATEQGARFIPEQTNYSESTEKAPRFDNMEPNHIAAEKSTERHNADSSLGCPSRPLMLAHGPHSQNKQPSSTLDSTFMAGGESKDCEAMAVPSGPPAVQTRAPIRTQTRHPARRTSSYVRNGTTFMTHTRYDENLHAMLDGPLRRLDLEFSHLSSWVQSQSVPIGTMLMNEMASSAIRSSKRRKLNDVTSTGPSDDKIDESLSRYMDFRIGAAFEKVRIRIAEELKNACGELTRELQHGTGLLSKSPSSSPEVSSPRQSQFS